MRYVTVFTDGEEYMLHHPFSAETQIFQDELIEEMGKTSQFSFSVPPTNENISRIIPLSSEIRIYENSERIFYGRVVSPKSDLYNTKTVVCVGGLSYLADSLQAPFVFEGTGTGLLEMLLEVHNSMVESHKKLELGIVNVAIREESFSLENYSDTLSVLDNLFVQKYGGYLRVREAENVRYLDYVTTYGGTNSQVIRFGENVIDLSREMSGSDIVTLLIPEGAEIEDGNGNKSRVNITSVNGGVNYISNVDAVEAWGRVWGYMQRDDITDPEELLEAAEQYLENLTSFPETITLTAFDLSLIDSSVEALKLGFWTQFISTPHEIAGTRLLQKKVTHITAPQNDKITFGITRQTLTNQTVNTGHVVSLRVEQMRNQLGKEIDEKVDNATKLIAGGTGGCFVIGTNEQGQPNETYWMDAPDRTQAQNVIRINMNGIGFSASGFDGPYTNAWTIDGNLVADFITAGTMLADRIRGGSLEVGGSGVGKDGVILIRNVNDGVIGRLDKNGISIGKGTISGSNITGSTIEVGAFYADEEEVGIGGFYVRDSWGRSMIQSNDQSCGMSASSGKEGGLWFWAGYESPSSYDFLVNNAGQMKVKSGNIVVGAWNEGNTNNSDRDDIYIKTLHTEYANSDGGVTWAYVGYNIIELWEEIEALSDRKVKKDIVDIDPNKAAQFIIQSRPVKFKYVKDNRESVGFIAQEVNELQEILGTDFPLVKMNKPNNALCIEYERYIPLIIATLKQMDKRIKELEKGE